MVLSLAATNIQLGLLRHAGVVMATLKLSAALSTCDHESCLFRRKIGCKVLMKLRGIEVSETVRRLYRARLAEITRKAFSVVRLILSTVWHVGCNVHQTGNR
jgi:hypothetical protein